MNYYNEFDKKTAAWLRELIAQGYLPKGHVDDRSIVDVQPGDLAGYTQCHFFAGIGGWPYALQLAGWPTTKPVWTGSCPCQPFSVAGKGLGTKDARHLWPEMFRLIRECRPTTVFGEQVASKAGREWLGHLLADVESVGYAGAGSDLCSAGVGADHVRQRLFWVADSKHDGSYRANGLASIEDKYRSDGRLSLGDSNQTVWVADARYSGKRRRAESVVETLSTPTNGGGLGESDISGLEGPHRNGQSPSGVYSVHIKSDCGLLHAASGRRAQDDDSLTSEQPHQADARGGTTTVLCGDGKTRRLGSGITPVAHGIPARVVRLRGYGNAIDPRVASEFIGAFMDLEATA